MVAIGGVEAVVKGWYGAVAIGGVEAVVKRGLWLYNPYFIS